MKKTLRILMLLTVLFGTAKMNAQVTIGADVEPKPFSILELYAQYETGTFGGLRLPQMTTAQRNGLFTVTDKPAEAKGLVIYNLDNNCVEYWNDTKWVSLCTGQAAITFEPGDPTVPMFPFVDTTRGPFVPHDEPDCVEQNPAYAFIVMSGADYLHIHIMNEATGQFTVTMDANPTAHERIAIVRIINNCTQEHKDFIFTQDYDHDLCNISATPPTIVSHNYNSGTSLCGSGAVYLYMTVPANPAGYVWARNGLEVARNVSNYVATIPGTYKVYARAIGCDTPIPASITVTAGTSGAPAPVSIVVGENNGYVCEDDGELMLFASASSAGQIVWYKDGVKTGETGSSVHAGIGTWFAVVENGSCSSLPSNTVSVIKHPGDGEPINQFKLTVNGVAPVGNSISLCSGGSLLLEVVGAGAGVVPEPGVTYTWYAGDAQNGLMLGVGSTCATTVSVVRPYPILQCVAEKPGSCTQAKYTEFTISVNNPPARPVITSNTGNTMCASGTYLTATSAGADHYLWYKDGVSLGLDTNSIAISALGVYTVYAVSENGCVSDISIPLNIFAASGFAESLSISGNTHPNINAVETYIATMTNAISATYTWSIDAPHTIMGGQGTSSVIVRFGTVTGDVDLRVTAANACGDAKPKPKTLTLTVDNPCSIFIAGHYPSDRIRNVTYGNNPNISVTANSSYPVSYQWYYNASPSNTGGSSILCSTPGLTGQTELAVGTHYFYCVATANCSGSPKDTSSYFTINVSINPAAMPEGNGTLSGKSCFDIAESTCDGTTAANRVSSKTDFSLRTLQNTGDPAPYHGVQKYTFTATSAGVSNVRYMIVLTQATTNVSTIGDVIDLTTPTYNTPETGTLVPGGLPNGTSTNLTVYYKNDLNSKLLGVSRANAAKLMLYIIYTDASTSTDRTVSLNISIQDCGCCGAKISATVWKEFMCHNLGADYSADPFTPAAALCGAKYKWGAKTPALTMAQDQASASAVSGWTSITPPPSNSVLNWDMTTANPCPTGYRVPTLVEWTGVKNNNTATTLGTWSSNTWTSAKQFGALILPAAGHRYSSDGSRDTGGTSGAGNVGMYWASTCTSTTNNIARFDIYKSKVEVTNTAGNRNSGESVRCIAE